MKRAGPSSGERCETWVGRALPDEIVRRGVEDYMRIGTLAQSRSALGGEGLRTSKSL